MAGATVEGRAADVTPPAVSPFKGRTWVSLGSPTAEFLTPTPPVTPSPEKRSGRPKSRSQSRPRTAGSTALSVWQPPSPWLSGRVDWFRTQGGTPRTGRKKRTKRPQSAPVLTDAEVATASPRVQAVEDAVASGSHLSLGYEHERVLQYQRQLHQHERTRREREATLRRLRDESRSLELAVGAVVPTNVARLMELELQLDRVYHRHHAQTVAKQKALVRIETLRKKAPLREQRVVEKREELNIVAREIVQRGEELAESSNRAKQARTGLEELQEQLLRQRSARQQELAALHAHLGVDALAENIKAMEQKVSELNDVPIMCKAAHERQLAHERELERLRHRVSEERAQTASLVSKRLRFERTRRHSYEARLKLDALRANAADVDAKIVALQSELADMKQLAERRAVCEVDLTEANEALKDSQDDSLQKGRNNLDVERRELLQSRAHFQASLVRSRSATEAARAEIARLQQGILDADARLHAKQIEIKTECAALKQSADRAREEARAAEKKCTDETRRLDQITAEQNSVAMELADAKTATEDLQTNSHGLRVASSRRRDVSKIRSDLRQVNSELADARTKEGSLAEEMESVHHLAKLSQRVTEQLKDGKTQLLAVQSQEKEVHTESESLTCQIERLEEELDQATAAAAEISPRVDELRDVISQASVDAEARRQAVVAEVEEAERRRLDVLQQVQQIDARLIEELRSMPRPPAGVEITLIAVLIILGKGNQPTWEDVRKLLDEHFTIEVLKFDQSEDSTITRDNVEILLRHMAHEDFNDERVRHASLAAGLLCSWVRAQVIYAQAIQKQNATTLELEKAEQSLNQQRLEHEAAVRVVDAAAKLSHRIKAARSDLNDKTAELASLENSKLALQTDVARLQDENETLRRKQLGHQTEITIKTALNHVHTQIEALEQQAQRLSSDLHNAEDIEKQHEDINRRLSRAREHEQDVQIRSELLMDKRAKVVAEHRAIESIMSEALSLAAQSDSRATELRAEMTDIESHIAAGRVDAQEQITSLLDAAKAGDRTAAEAEVKLAELGPKLAKNEEALTEVRSLMAMQSSRQLKLLTKHNDELAAIVAALGEQLESLRKQAGAQRPKTEVETELQALSALPAQLMQAIDGARAEYQKQQLLAEEDATVASTMDRAIAAAEASVAYTSKCIQQIVDQVEEDQVSCASLTKAAHSAHQQQEKIREELVRLNTEMALKASNRPNEIDPETGAIVPPHQAHFDSRWTRSAPVGRTERLRCLSAGPSPNRPPTARHSKQEARHVDKGGQRNRTSDDAGETAREKRIAQAWHAITHATGRSTEADITARLLEHADEHERLQLSKSALDEQRESLRDTLRLHRQELSNVMHCEEASSVTPLVQNGDKGDNALQNVQRDLKDAKAQLDVSVGRLTPLTELLATVVPGLKQMVQACDSGVVTALACDDIDADEAASLLSIVDRRMSFLLGVLESAGLALEPDLFQPNISARNP